MTEFEKKAKYEEVLNDADFMKKVESTTSPEELKELMATKGIIVTASDAEKAFGIMSNEEELPEEVLEEVNGGLAWFAIGMIGYGAVYGVAFCIHQMTKPRR